jgi:hypothetical protein
MGVGFVSRTGSYSKSRSAFVTGTLWNCVKPLWKSVRFSKELHKVFVEDVQTKRIHPYASKRLSGRLHNAVREPFICTVLLGAIQIVAHVMAGRLLCFQQR